MADRVVTLTALEAAGYSREELRRLGVPERTGHAGEVVYDREELSQAGVRIDGRDE